MPLRGKAKLPTSLHKPTPDLSATPKTCVVCYGDHRQPGHICEAKECIEVWKWRRSRETAKRRSFRPRAPPESKVHGS